MRLLIACCVALISITLGCDSPPEKVKVTTTGEQSAPGEQPSSTEAVPKTEPNVDGKKEDAEAKVEDPTTDPAGLHNVKKLSGRIYSGSEPDGEAGFESLSELGIQVVVSVDGARPNVEEARKHGLRYVHIPFGYDGITEKAGKALARLVNEADGPFYIHCHHGKHRGPAAAAVACIADGTENGKSALHILEWAGTSKNYAGLWRDVEAYQPPAAGEQLPELVEVAEVSSLAAAMAKIDRAFDNLKLCRDAFWQTPADHPDIVPKQEALLVKEGLREVARNLSTDKDDRFKNLLAEAVQRAGALEESFAGANADNVTTDQNFDEMNAACQQCHKAYRN